MDLQTSIELMKKNVIMSFQAIDDAQSQNEYLFNLLLYGSEAVDENTKSNYLSLNESCKGMLRDYKEAMLNGLDQLKQDIC